MRTDERTQYEQSPFPVFAVDEKLQVIWTNPAADSVCPFLKAPNGLAEILKDSLYYVSGVLQESRKPAVFQSNSRFSEMLLYFIPEYQGDEFAGALVQCGNEWSADGIRRRYKLLRQMQDYMVESVSNSFLMLRQVKENCGNPQELSDVLDRLYLQNMRMLRFARNCSVYSDYAYGQSGSCFANLELSQLIGDLCARIKTVLGDKVSFQYERPETVLLLVGDSDKLSRAITAVVRDAAEGAAQIDLHVELNDDQADVIVISDATDADRPSLSMLKSEISEPVVSDGDHLGLLTAKMIINEHGGSVRVQSLGQVTRYDIFLPLGSDPTMKLEQSRMEYHTDFDDVTVELCDYTENPFEK